MFIWLFVLGQMLVKLWTQGDAFEKATWEQNDVDMIV